METKDSATLVLVAMELGGIFSVNFLLGVSLLLLRKVSLHDNRPVAPSNVVFL